jgi:hypothetical protein
MLEYRHDSASGPIYFSGDVMRDPLGLDVPNASSQNTLTVGAVGWF